MMRRLIDWLRVQVTSVRASSGQLDATSWKMDFPAAASCSLSLHTHTHTQWLFVNGVASVGAVAVDVTDKDFTCWCWCCSCLCFYVSVYVCLYVSLSYRTSLPRHTSLYCHNDYPSLSRTRHRRTVKTSFHLLTYNSAAINWRKLH